jgi:hypothetical protein
MEKSLTGFQNLSELIPQTLHPHRPEHCPFTEAFADEVERLVEADHFGGDAVNKIVALKLDDEGLGCLI